MIYDICMCCMQRYFQQEFFSQSWGTFKPFSFDQGFPCLVQEGDRGASTWAHHAETPLLGTAHSSIDDQTRYWDWSARRTQSGKHTLHVQQLWEQLKNIPLASQRLKTIGDQHLLSCVTDTRNLRPIRVPKKEGFTAVTQFHGRDFLMELIVLLLLPF